MKVRVRMYCQGIGDCFLLTCFAPGGPRHILVDCGVLLGTRDGTEIMTAVARDIRVETNGRLQALVATHEHWDHISGFLQAREEFDRFASIEETWFAWTENLEDPLARKLRTEREARKAGLRIALARWNDNACMDRALTESLLGFFGDAETLGATGRTTHDALEYLLARCDAGSRRFLEPGHEFEIPGVADLRVYVLGPPRDEAALRKDRPSGKRPETYGLRSEPPSLAASFLAAVQDGAVAAGDDRSHPFDSYYRIPIEMAQQPGSYFAQRYGFDGITAGADAAAWRRIDDDWLRVASDLAIALDSDTNNSSLVLAFELGLGGDVILLAADAQVGNWLSWQDVRFQVRAQGGTQTVTANDLLARTVLYKVGHHASHNATLRELGLERMTHPNLAAMIPVDQEMAKKKKWNMPFPDLLGRLTERTRGRILRIDEKIPTEDVLRTLPDAERKDFLSRATYNIEPQPIGSIDYLIG